MTNDVAPLIADTADVCGRLDLFHLLTPDEQEQTMADACDLVDFLDLVIGDDHLEDNDPGWRGVTYPPPDEGRQP